MKKAPRRRYTDRLRELADRLWDRGEKEEATEMHDLARKAEELRAKEFEQKEKNDDRDAL